MDHNEIETLPIPSNTVSISQIMLNAPLLAQIDAMAKRMASARATIPKHLAGNEGDCWAVIMQAIQWKMNPFVVAQKTHVVNGTLGYEAQLVNAVVQASGMITGRFHYEYADEGANLRCRVGAVLAGEQHITWGEWLCRKDVTVQNSPVWKTNPKQQMGYLQLKNWVRLYCPGAILGVYTAEELQDAPPIEREINPCPPAPATTRTESLKSRLGVITRAEMIEDAGTDLAPDTETPNIELPPASEPEPDTRDAGQDQPPANDAAEDIPWTAVELTFAAVAEELNRASSPRALQHSVKIMADFIGIEGNEKYREELGTLYRMRLKALKAGK